MTIRHSLAAQKATGGKIVPPPDVIDMVTADSRRYAADTAKTKAEADKEVGRGDAKVSD
jgi:hypothetical protein